MPPALGTKIIAAGAPLTILCASWPAPEAMRRDPSQVDRLETRKPLDYKATLAIAPMAKLKLSIN